jgi:CubicO group peptidase (beta-lactamase class C family)
MTQPIKGMQTIFACILLIAAVLAQQTFDPTKVASSFQSYFTAASLKAAGTTNVFAVVTQGNSMLYSEGFGTKGDGRSITPDLMSLYPIASVTKTFTVTTIFQMV